MLITSFLISDVSKLVRLLTKNERCEQSAKVAHQKWAIMSDSLIFLQKTSDLPRKLMSVEIILDPTEQVN